MAMAMAMAGRHNMVWNEMVWCGVVWCGVAAHTAKHAALVPGGASFIDIPPWWAAASSSSVSTCIPNGWDEWRAGAGQALQRGQPRARIHAWTYVTKREPAEQ
jgi:hypothetical protein